MTELPYSYKNIEEVEKEYRWDLEACLEGQPVEYYLEKFSLKSQEVLEFKALKYKSKDNYLKAHELERELYKYFLIASTYLSNRVNTNLTDSEYNKSYFKLKLLYQQHSVAYGSEDNLLAKHEKDLRLWAKDERFTNIRRQLLFSLDCLKYKLSDSVEEYLVQTQKGQVSLHKIFSILRDTEVDYGVVNVKGKEIKITEGNIHQLLQNKEEEVRKTSYHKYAAAVSKHRETFSQLLIQHLRKNVVVAKVRGYSSCLNSLLLEDGVTSELLDTLYKNTEKLTPLMGKYLEWKKKFFQKRFNKEMRPWDTRVSLVDAKQSYTIEEAKEILIGALSAMPADYFKVFKKALYEERWVDYMNYPNKRSGAYSIGGSYYSPKKYILMNYDGTLNSVITLAHEFGHSMHSYFADKHQDFYNSQYPIFLAEIASVFNEIFVYNYLLDKHKEEKEMRFNIIEKFISEINDVIVRQVIFSNYERDLYQALEKEEPLTTFKDLDRLFFQINQKYTLKLTPEKWEEQPMTANLSCVVPHYYYDFYVYKYALGFMIGCNFYGDYKKRGEVALRNYIDNFLSAGGNDWPANLLKKAGVDIYSKNLAQATEGILKELVERYIELGKEIFNLN